MLTSSENLFKFLTDTDECEGFYRFSVRTTSSLPIVGNICPNILGIFRVYYLCNINVKEDLIIKIFPDKIQYVLENILICEISYSVGGILHMFWENISFGDYSILMNEAEQILSLTEDNFKKLKESIPHVNLYRYAP